MIFLLIFSYYSSPALFDKLRSEDTTAVETVRLTRKEMPIALKRKMKKGEIICRQRENLLALKWTDKRDVSILSTKHTAQCSVLLNKVDRNTGDPVSKPSAILDYSCNMGGVDLSDQLNKYYSMRRKTWKWWIKLFFFICSIWQLQIHTLSIKKLQDHQCLIFSSNVNLFVTF